MCSSDRVGCVKRRRERRMVEGGGGGRRWRRRRKRVEGRRQRREKGSCKICTTDFSLVFFSLPANSIP